MALRNSRKPTERGAELVEFALVLPLLLAIVAGIIDFGFLFQRQLVLQNAAREGARVVVLPSYTAADAVARAREYARAGLGLTAAEAAAQVNVVVSEPETVDLNGAAPPPAFMVVRVRVTMTQGYPILGPIMRLLGAADGSFGDITLAAESTMRREA